jgi:heme exporter protein C
MKKRDYLLIFDIVCGILLAVSLAMVLFYAPVERVMGLVQKVFYYHVATAWLGMMGFILAAVAGGMYLHTHADKWDQISYSAVELGLVFAVVCIATGSIWARPIWNTWWTWDPRLTTAAIMALVYLAYLMLRGGLDDPEKRARFGSIYAILGALSVPLTFLSIRLFRTIHPVVVGTGSAAFDMAPKMLQTFLFGLLVWTLLFIDLVIHRYRLAKLQAEVEARQIELMD